MPRFKVIKYLSSITNFIFISWTWIIFDTIILTTVSEIVRILQRKVTSAT